MRALASPSLPIILLYVLVGAKQAFADSAEDAFGFTNYGFKCANRVYKKYDIFAAAKKLCDEKAKSKSVREETNVDASTPWIQAMLCPNNHFSGEALAEIPIFKDGTLFPIELSPVERVVVNSNGIRFTITPGRDRLVIGASCNIVGAYTDHGFENEQGVRYETCTLLKSPGDTSESLENQTSYCGNSPTRYPKGFPRQTFSQSSSRDFAKSIKVPPRKSPSRSSQIEFEILPENTIE